MEKIIRLENLYPSLEKARIRGTKQIKYLKERNSNYEKLLSLTKYKEEYEIAIDDLNNAKKVKANDSLEGIYDVTMKAFYGEDVKIVRQLDGYLKVSLLLPEGINKKSK